MMAFFRKIKEITKNQSIDVWFFFLFLLTFTLSVRKVLFYFPIQGNFNEYSGIYLYLSDIFLFLAISVWLFSILCNNKELLSSFRLWIKSLYKQKLLILPLILVIWSFMTIIWSQNQIIAFFRSIKLLEFYLLYLYVIIRFVPQCKNLKCSTFTLLTPNVPRGTFGVFTGWNILALAVIFVATIHSSIGIAQFISQESLGITFFKESILSQDVPGVAKIVFGGEKYIRAYGLFPHPNVFGGFLLLSITITFLFFKLFHACPTMGRVEQKQEEQDLDLNNTKNLQGDIFGIIVPRGTIIKNYLEKVLLGFLLIMLFDHYFWDIQQGILTLWITFGLIAGMNINSPNCSTWNNLESRSRHEINIQEQTSPNKSFDFFPEKYSRLIRRTLQVVLVIQILALVLTFSKSAIFTGLLIFILFHVEQYKTKLANSNKKASELSLGRDMHFGPFQYISKLFHVEHLRTKKMLLGLILILALIYPSCEYLNLKYFLIQPARERIEYLNVSRGTIASSPILGVGSGQAVLLSQHFSQKVLEPYEYQPVHNVFLLIWSELGIVGLVLFLLFLKELFHIKNINCSTWNN